MDLHLKGKKAIVLGGTRGIGRAIAETLAAEGADVAVCARNQGQIDDTTEALRKHGTRAFGAAVDIADHDSLRRWIAEAAVELGGLDILISNAGALAQGNDEEAWMQNFRVDVLGGGVSAFDAAKDHLIAAAAANGDAAFIMISSVSAAESDSGGSYGPMKAALIHYAKGLARQYGPKQVRVNVVSPGTTYFEGGVWHMVEQSMPEAFKASVARNPLGRMATPQEIANAAVFLASPAASFVSGVNLLVDGSISRRVNF